MGSSLATLFESVEAVKESTASRLAKWKENIMDRPCDSPALYPGLLGPSWRELHENVRHMHVEGQAVQASGKFEVRRGDNCLARCLGRWARLPAAGDSVPVALTIVPHAHMENWQRNFAGQPLLSRQWVRKDGLLAEQLGCLELRFRLEIIGSELHYRPCGAWLRIGGLFMPLPGLLTPRVEAWETAAEEPDRVSVHVEVQLPLLGLLVSYRGTMTRSETG